MPNITAIWAQDKNGLIGRGDQLPWHIPADLAHFKNTTEGHPILMGRRTFEGMGRRVLPNRHTLILTSDKDYQIDHPNVTVVNCVQNVLSFAPDKHLYIVGGAQIYRTFAPHINELIITEIDAEFDGDVYFPSDFPFDNFELQSTTRISDTYPFSINTYIRKD